MSRPRTRSKWGADCPDLALRLRAIINERRLTCEEGAFMAVGVLDLAVSDPYPFYTFSIFRSGSST